MLLFIKLAGLLGGGGVMPTGVLPSGSSNWGSGQRPSSECCSLHSFTAISQTWQFVQIYTSNNMWSGHRPSIEQQFMIRTKTLLAHTHMPWARWFILTAAALMGYVRVPDRLLLVIGGCGDTQGLPTSRLNKQKSGPIKSGPPITIRGWFS